MGAGNAGRHQGTAEEGSRQVHCPWPTIISLCFGKCETRREGAQRLKLIERKPWISR